MDAGLVHLGQVMGLLHLAWATTITSSMVGQAYMQQVVAPADCWLAADPCCGTQPPPPATTMQSWVASIVKRNISNRSFLKSVFTFQGRRPSSCSLESFTYEKLCVPQVRRGLQGRAMPDSSQLRLDAPPLPHTAHVGIKTQASPPKLGASHPLPRPYHTATLQPHEISKWTFPLAPPHAEQAAGCFPRQGEDHPQGEGLRRSDVRQDALLQLG